MRRTASIVRKDLVQVFRNRFIAVITVLMIIVMALIYNLMSSEVNETYKLGLCVVAGESGVQVEANLEELAAEAGNGNGQGLEIEWADTVEELERLVEEEEVSAGILLDFSATELGAVLYVSSQTPDEVKDAGEALADEMVYALAGYRLPADINVTMVGRDMAGAQIPLRDRLRVLLLSFVFLLELYGLGNLLMEEIRRKTAQALLVTPVTLREFVGAKAVTGVVMAFSQGVLLALLIGAISRDTWLSLLVFLLLGAAMVVGLAFIMGAISSDFISMVMVSMIPFMALMIPGVVLLYPGFDSPWIKAIPTYYLVDPINGILNYQMGLADYLSSVLALALFAAGFFVLGFFILRRKLA